jgi:Polyketide cyclase / dehydrase and lipid transport
MIVVERSFAVTAAPDVVLAYFQDFGNCRDWDPSAVGSSRIGAGPLGPGARWRHARTFFGVTAELTYTLLDAGADRLVFSGRSEGATCTDTIVVRPAAGGTEVGYRVDLEMHGLAKLTTPLMRVRLEKLATASVASVTAALTGAPQAAPHQLGATGIPEAGRPHRLGATGIPEAGRPHRLGAELTRGGIPPMTPATPNRLPTPAEETG